MTQMLRNIIFWALLIAAIVLSVIGIIHGDLFEARMEASTL